MKRLLVSAAFLTSGLMGPALHAVKITTSDGKEFDYTSAKDIALLRQCDSMYYLLRYLSGQVNCVVPLSMSAQCWQRIFDYLRLADLDSSLHYDVTDYAIRKQQLYEIRKKQLDEEVAQLTREELCMLLNGCGQLGAPEMIFASALDRCITNPELLLSTNNENCQLSSTARKMLDERLAHYLRKEGINNSQKPVTKITHFETMSKQPSTYFFGEDATYIGGFDDGTICIWDIVSGDVLHKIQLSTHKIEVLEKFYSDDRDYLAWIAGNKMHFWDIDDERLVLTLDASEKCFFCVKGNVIIGDKSTGAISILDFPSDKVLQTFYHPGVTVLNISSSGDRLVTSSQDGIVKIWGLESGALVKTLSHADREINYLNVIDEDEDVLIVETNTKLYLYNITTQKLMYESDCNYSLHDDGHIFCAHNATIDLIDCETGERLGTFTGHHGKVVDLDCQNKSLLADDNFLISASEDGIARVWNIQTGQAIHILKHALPVRQVFVFEDGNYLATVTNDGKPHFWNFMARMQDLIDNSSLEQRLLLALGYQKKKHQQTVDLTHKPHLAKLLGAYDKATQDLVCQTLPIQRSTQRSLMLRAYQHRNKLVAVAGLGALGYLAWQYLKK